MCRPSTVACSLLVVAVWLVQPTASQHKTMVAIAKSFKVGRNDFEAIPMASSSPIVILDMKDIMSLRQKHVLRRKWQSICNGTQVTVLYDLYETYDP